MNQNFTNPIHLDNWQEILSLSTQECSLPHNDRGQIIIDKPIIVTKSLGEDLKGENLFIKLSERFPDLQFLWLGQWQNDPEQLFNNLFIVNNPDNYCFYLKKSSLFIGIQEREYPLKLIFECLILGLPSLIFTSAGNAKYLLDRYGYVLSGEPSLDSLILFIEHFFSGDDGQLVLPEWIVEIRGSGWQTERLEELIKAVRITEMRDALEEKIDYINIGIESDREGNTVEAIDNYQKAIAIQPQQPVWVYSFLVDRLISLNRIEAAIEFALLGLKIYPEQVDLYRNLGVACDRQGKVEAVIKNYQQAIILDRQQPAWVYCALIDRLQANKKLEKALEVATQGLTIYPENGELYRWIGVTQFKQRNIAEAIVSYEKALTIEESLNVYQLLGEALLQQERLEEAENTFRKVISLDVNYYRAYFYLGKLFFKQNFLEKAIAAYQQAYSLNSNSSEVCQELSYCLYGKIKQELASVLKIYNQSSIAKYIDDACKNIDKAVHEIKLIVPHSDKPLISIIVPVYNKIEYTLQCLKALSRNIKSTTKVEVIVINDCSTDRTQEILENTEGVILVNNEKNLGFIHSCNKGASFSQGEYLYFLNNDTEILPNCIESLIDVFLNDSQVGAVGSKLLYPDDTLQEAGGIIWSDSSGWNYGRTDNPRAPQYNYLRPVDYCSGASLLVRKGDFERLGFFEKDFAPAYYEDTDLCFAIRNKLGLKVMYQPKSELIHYEGVSSGTSTSSGVKRYQVINAVKFKDKWQQALAQHLTCNNGKNVHRACRRYLGDKVILVIDSYPPCYDKESGSRRLFQLLKILRELNYHVIFAPDNGYKEEPYISELQNLQIEVLYTCDGYGISIEKQIEDRFSIVDVAWICRPELNEKYIPFLQQQKNIKIVYDTIDLHYLRMKRAWELSTSPRDIHQAKEWVNMQARELKLAKEADMTVTVTLVEKEILHQQGIDNVAVIPNIHEMDRNEIKGFHEREGILFIGGYNHTPNVDGVIWLCEEIMPLVWEKLPGLKVTLLGSNPSETVKKLSSDRVIVTGYVRDVSPYFLNHRIFVSPLRYGAGMKGKIGQSLEYRLPIVSTDIGIEGMNLKPGENLILANDAQEFIEGIVNLYQNESLWNKLANNSELAITPYFPETVKNNVKLLLEKLIK
jgi:GT2 family glycosyltransferase/tetratricopeptide (TPR) repeat protein